MGIVEEIERDSAKAVYLIRIYAMGHSINKAANKCGITQACASKIVNGVVKPSPATIDKIIRALDD